MVEGSHLVIAGFALILLGVLLVFAGTLVYALSKPARVEGGGVILIGPIPIIFGTSTTMAIVAAVVAIVLMVLAIIFMLLASRAIPQPG